jgi:hypothetical protein
MANSHVSKKLAQRGLVKDLAYKAHVGMYVNTMAICGGDPGAFLATMLKSV